MSRFNTLNRLENLREKIAEKKLDALVVSSPANRYYLTGWLGDMESGYLLITQKTAFIITDSRYTEEVGLKVAGFQLREFGLTDDFWPSLFKEAKVDKIGFEASDISLSQLKKIKKNTQVKFYQTEYLIEQLRSIKDKEELVLIKKAIAIAEGAFEQSLQQLYAGISEKEIAWKLEKSMRDKGASKNAWDPLIVAFGSNSSKPHYFAGDKKVRKGDQILFDWGCYYQGYCCDISRMVFLGTPTAKQVEIYNLVVSAQAKAAREIQAGSKTMKADSVARSFLQTKTKFGFGHGLGHGVGINVHELPKLGPKTNDRFQEGNIITIEPGVYIPGWGGVRIEDMYLVGEQGSTLLTKAPKKLSEIVLS